MEIGSFEEFVAIVDILLITYCYKMCCQMDLISAWLERRVTSCYEKILKGKIWRHLYAVEGVRAVIKVAWCSIGRGD